MLLRDAPRGFSEITGHGVEERFTSRSSGTQYTVLAWRMPGASRCDVARGGDRLDADAVQLTCEWSYGRFVDEAEVRQHAQAMFTALADCMQKELTATERSDSSLELRGTLKSTHAIELDVSAGNASGGHTVSFTLVMRGGTPGGG